MAWTAPRTWVTSEVVTASIMNTHVRDNFLETAPAVATTAGRLIQTSGANSVVERSILSDRIDTSETTASTSFTDLATSGPAVTVTTGTAALVWVAAALSNNTAGSLSLASFGITGATTSSANDGRGIRYESSVADDAVQMSTAQLLGVTAGSNTFTMKYRVDGNTGTFHDRHIIVLGL